MENWIRSIIFIIRQKLFELLSNQEVNLIDTSVLHAYNQGMDTTFLPAQQALLDDAAQRDVVTARRKLLLEFLSRERYLTRRGLISRVEALLGKGCFGDSSWEDVFYRDMRAVKSSLQAAGFELAYSRSKARSGYYLKGEEALGKIVAQQIEGAVAEVDPEQMAVTQTLTPAERAQQGLSITNLAHRVTSFRKSQRKNVMADTSSKYQDFVLMVLDALETLDVPYLIGGAVAVWAYGDPRATRDLDLVVQISEDDADKLSEELEKRDMFLPAEINQERLKDRWEDGPLNAIHGASGFKADLFFLREGDAFRKEAFQRRALVNLGPGLGKVYLHTPEDLIISKLYSYSISQQTKHLRDIASIIHSLGDELDVKYLEKWLAAKDLQTLWKSIQRKIQSQL